MATTRIQTTTVIAATTEVAVHTVVGGKLDTIRVHVTNKAEDPITWRLFIDPLGGGHSDDQAVVWDETLSAPGSGHSEAFVLAATDVVRVYASIAGLRVTVNGISQDA